MMVRVDTFIIRNSSFASMVLENTVNEKQKIFKLQHLLIADHIHCASQFLIADTGKTFAFQLRMHMVR